MLNTLRQAIYVNPVLAALPGVMIFIVDLLQPDERWVARCHGCEELDMDCHCFRSPIAADRQPLCWPSGHRSASISVGGGLLAAAAKWCAPSTISLSVTRSETWSAWSESGCGKVDTARLLIRLIGRHSGTMVLDGDPVDEPHGISVNELRRQVQMVSRTYAPR